MYNSYFQWHKPKECEHAKNFLTSSEGVCVHCVASSIRVNRMCNNNWTEWCFLSCLSTYFLHLLTMLTQAKLFHHHLLIFLPFQMAFVWDTQTKFQLLLFFFSVCRLVIGPPKRSEWKHFLHTHLIETWWEFFRESFKWDWIDLGVLLILWGRWRLICDITITFTPALNLNALRRISLPCSHSVLYKGTPSLSKMCLSDTLTDYSFKKKPPLTIQKKSPFFLWVINEWRKCLFLSSVNW